MPVGHENLSKVLDSMGDGNVLLFENHCATRVASLGLVCKNKM